MLQTATVGGIIKLSETSYPVDMACRVENIASAVKVSMNREFLEWNWNKQFFVSSKCIKQDIVNDLEKAIMKGDSVLIQVDYKNKQWKLALEKWPELHWYERLELTPDVYDSIMREAVLEFTPICDDGELGRLLVRALEDPASRPFPIEYPIAHYGEAPRILLSAERLQPHDEEEEIRVLIRKSKPSV